MVEALIAEQYPQLNDIVFLDYAREAPVPRCVVEKIRSLGQRLMASPHSSEEQSDFDRVLMLLRKAVASLFSVSLANFDVIIFGTPEAALEAFFESFGWPDGSKYLIHESFEIPSASSVEFAERAGASRGTFEANTSVKALICVPATSEGAEAVSKLKERKYGTHTVLGDATSSAPFEFANLMENVFNFVLLSMKHICGIELCLAVVKKESAELLVPSFYGGGAVAFSCARSPDHRNFLSNAKRFENGTPPLVNIFAAYEGLLLMNKLRETCNQNERVDALIQKLVDGLKREVRVNHCLKRVYIPVPDSQALHQKLIAQKVFCGVDESNIIVSLGLSSTERDIDRFLEVFASICAF